MIKHAKRLFRRALRTRRLLISTREDNGSQFDLVPFFLEYLISQGFKGAILQVGANDGVMDDPIRAFLIKYHIPAILVEPQPSLFAKLKKNYEGFTSVRFENVAIGRARNKLDLYFLDANATHLPKWAQGLASLDRNVVAKHQSRSGVPADFINHIRSTPVEVITISDLIGRHKDLCEFILLQIDTEGHDAVVVEAAIAANLKPPLINYEHRHLCPSDEDKCRDLLMNSGYRLVDHQQNTLAVREDLIHIEA